jgi:hypothetical protein
MPTKLSTIEIDMSVLDDILRRIDANTLTKDDCESLRTLCRSYVQLTELLKDKPESVMIFGCQVRNPPVFPRQIVIVRISGTSPPG